METKANYVAVGIFVLSCMFATAVAMLWLAGAQFADEYAVYRTYFQGAVTGLGTGTMVRYNGIDVGTVREVDFDPDDPRQVIADLQIDPDIRLREDSLASLEMQGLTGGIFVQITGGTPQAEFLVAEEGEDFPVIETQASAIQQFIEGTPELLTRLTELTDSGIDLINAQNRAALAETFTNLRDITGAIATRSEEIDQALASLGPTIARLETVLASVDNAVGQIGSVAVSANETAQSITQLATGFDESFNRSTVPQMDQLIVETRALIASLGRLSEAIERQPTQLLFGDRREGYAPQ
jgi:phospholipid/cholesterol/gamma-HCH transport system substrate-binding protein